jgi:MSHA biogenesis protein MshI
MDDTADNIGAGDPGVLGLFKKKPRKNTFAAICPGDEMISVAVVRRDEGVPPVLELCVAEPRDKQIDLQKQLQSLLKQHDIGNVFCSSMMELNEYSLLLVEAPDVPPSELKAAMRWKVKDMIDFHIDDALIDVFEVPTAKGSGRNSVMYAVVARIKETKQRIDTLVEAGFELSCIDIPELALRNIASLLPEDVSGVALVQIGPRRGLITISRQSTLYFSRRIDTGTDVLFSAVPGDELNERGEGWLDSIVIEIQRSLDYYDSHFSQQAVSGVVLAPLGRNIHGLEGYLRSQLDLPVRILDMNDLIDSKQILEVAQQVQCLGAVGAALRQEEKAL